MSARLRGLAPVAVAAVVCVGASAALYVVDPNEPGHLPPCPFRTLTGLYCPGCGSARALHALLHGNVGVSLARNPLTILAVAYLLFSWGAAARRAWTGTARRFVAPPWAMYGLAGALALFWVLRNLPGWTWLSPA